MSNDLTDVLASNVNDEVVVFRGSTTTELVTVAAISFVCVVPVALVLGLVKGALPLFLSLSLPLVFMMVFVVATVMQQVKRGKPDGYFQHKVAIALHQWHFRESRFVLEKGRMSTMRTQQCILIEQHLRQAQD